MLAPGAVVAGSRLGRLRTGRLLGEGGQGWVFQAFTEDGAAVAVKWYKPGAAVPEQWSALEYLVERGAPDPRYLWPLDLVRESSASRGGSFGYVMPLRPEGFASLANLVAGRGPHGRVLDVDHATVLTACRQLARTFQRLHAEGMCYRDISLQNVFFSATSGDVLVCDVDNVGIDDGSSRVLGTGPFMAPEIVRDRTRRTLPSTLTDRHSLAVLLFYALFGEHPLEGRRSDRGLRDEAHLLQHFGVAPLFCFDPRDDANRPVSESVIANWDWVYPSPLKRLLATAFTDGLHDPRARVVEGVWVKALRRLRDSMGTCPSCGATVFLDPDERGRRCWAPACRRPLPHPVLLRAGRRTVVVSRHLELTASHVGGTLDDEAVLGRASAHPQDPHRIGLVNSTSAAWTATLADGTTYRVEPGQVVELLAGLSLALPGGTAAVEAPPIESLPGRPLTAPRPR